MGRGIFYKVNSYQIIKLNPHFRIPRTFAAPRPEAEGRGTKRKLAKNSLSRMCRMSLTLDNFNKAH